MYFFVPTMVVPNYPFSYEYQTYNRRDYYGIDLRTI